MARTAFAIDCEETKSVTEFGRHASYGVIKQGTSLIPVPGAAAVDARYLRPLIKITGTPWLLTVRDASFRSIQVLTERDLASDVPRWTSRVNGNVAWIDFEAPEEVELSLPQYLIMPAHAEHTFYSRQDPDPSRSMIRPSQPRST